MISSKHAIAIFNDLTCDSYCLMADGYRNGWLRKCLCFYYPADSRFHT